MGNETSTARRPPIPFSCIPDLLEHQAKRIPDAPAIFAPGRSPLTYELLCQHIQKMASILRAMGIGRHDRVAVMLPNGPELPVAILAVAATATCAPMNPAYQSDEVERYFSDLRPRALITHAAIDSAARRAALSHGVRVIDLSPALDLAAGLFSLNGNRQDAPPDELVRPNHVAVLLLTSGTTSRPKIVPQTHANICAAAFSNVAILELKEHDRCLNVLPLFHGHGLHATVITSLAAGASVVCTPGLDTQKFCTWLTDFQPTWYSAVPTMHQAILTRAKQIRERIADCRLRFVRSSAAPLPPRFFKELEGNFKTPVIEFYSMAELAGAPIACNPLPPRRRKPGSVGIPVGLDVAIRDDGGNILPCGQSGQIVVRGPGLISGYDGNPEATRNAFAGGWFKTGDLGFFDDEGYLFLAGRNREVINRGGEKITPREVDEVLLEHPAVAEAVTFAAPHPTLGEDVAAAVVLRPRAKATAKQLRQYAKARLAAFKIPRQVLFVKEIPKGPTGKVKRVGLAAKLGLANSADISAALVAPRSSLEKVLAEVWAEVLDLEQVGIHDEFFALGGDSLMAVHLLTRIYEKLHLKIDVSRFFDGLTVAEVARHIERLNDSDQQSTPASSIVRVPRPNGLGPTSIAQERLWELHHALPNLPFFNILHALRLASPLNVALLERSINEIVRRHEILRTTFAVQGGQCAQVIAPHLSLPLAFHDLKALSRSKKESLGHELLQEEALHSFDLAKGPLIRACLLRLDNREHLLLISTHQAIFDGWSLGVFVEELVTLYDAFVARKEPPLAPLPIQFADFAQWQRAWRSHPEMVAQLAYWQEQLRSPLPSMLLAVSRAKRQIDNLRTARRAWALPANLAEAARRFSGQEGGTLFMTLVAALKALLHHYLGEDDVRVTTNVANRSRRETEGLIGPLANTVILRTNLSGDPDAREVMRRVRTTCLAAFANQDLPTEYLTEIRDNERGLKPATAASVMILLNNPILRPRSAIGRALTFEEVNANMLMPAVTLTTFDIILMLNEDREGLTGTCAYKPHLFNAGTIQCLLRDFEAVLERMVTRPARPISTIRVSFNRMEINRRSTASMVDSQRRS
jgi:acyl-CoA synthetase (AMP-forming)/AMP-acid ligase II/acyl carrier protein